ncbi:hypothetical protein LOTGIDRAFT_164662 [Lottia gigantea]|uniref:Endonuclease/exonuclease/phosphatase domain-containing protein n=1 Tax=Lottia gigantea TaxID=225164 RepID=V4A4Q6_LOTGI|nr:hypothetical protein LOTGIDRAFT_164662 [Lottia gigantea]ESO89965.1 hypothetical protein LOTGIDRAFT_164662 [Lottia gigantea]
MCRPRHKPTTTKQGYQTKEEEIQHGCSEGRRSGSISGNAKKSKGGIHEWPTSFIQLNINGLNVPERKTQLVQLLQRKQYDAVFLQESKLDSRNKDPIINGYTLIRLNRPNALNHRSGGGLAIYIKNVTRDRHVLWGSPTTDTNGRQVAEFIEANDLVSKNDGSITYVGAIAPLGSHLDLTLVSSRLAKDCTWEATSLRVFQQITDNVTKPNQTNDYHSTTNQQEIP